MAIHVRVAAHAADAAPNLQYLDLETNLIARGDGTPPLHAVHRHEVDDLLLDVLDRVHDEETTHLRHRLDDEHARHDRMTGVVALKERLVDSDVLDADNALARLELDDAVDEQHRVTMRQV